MNTYIFFFKDGMIAEARGESMISAFECVAPLYRINELQTWKIKEDQDGGKHATRLQSIS